MATATEIARLRSDIDANSTSLPDQEASDIFTEAGESYTDAASITAYTRILAIRRLLASSAKLTSYRQNESQESLSDVFKHLQALLKVWQDELATAVIAGNGSAVRSGRTQYKPARIKEYPGF